MTFILVVYDISNDRRRTKLHNILLDYGTPVQYSVFECVLDKKEQARMERAVSRIVRPRKGDSVRFYRLCADCVGKIKVLGSPDVTGTPPPAIVVGGERDADGG